MSTAVWVRPNLGDSCGRAVEYLGFGGGMALRPCVFAEGGAGGRGRKKLENSFLTLSWELTACDV
jgi:hypothetical protein